MEILVADGHEIRAAEDYPPAMAALEDELFDVALIDIILPTRNGMDEETKAHIFEPFYSTKEVNKGAGPRPATVYGIVRRNNGCIGVFSEPEIGATV